MNIMRLLTFEINRDCKLIELHRGRCPISHPERYKFSHSTKELTDELIIDFWLWCRIKGFRGVILWHMYNEPTLVIDRIRYLMKEMKKVDPFQPFQMTTSVEDDYSDFDIVKISDYPHAVLDNRILTNTGEGKPYSEMPKKGWCGRGLGWEIPIDNYGNWCLCCGDWRCEEAVGSICETDFEELYGKWKTLRKRMKWYDEASYNNLPRMCRSCLEKNPSLPYKGGI